MAGAIKAIETRYNGYRFRSRTEARWAVFFDAAGVRYEYEKEGYELPSGRYLPDFWLPDVYGGVWFEVKGKIPDSAEDQKATELAAHTGACVMVAWGPVTEESHRINIFNGQGDEWSDTQFGYGKRAAFDAAKSARFEHGETPHQNQTAQPSALTNLDAWVPDLDLPKCERHGSGYKAVPFWIPCPRRLPLLKRSPTLIFSPSGIMDIGFEGASHTPVDVVIGALGCTREFATDWLTSKLHVRPAHTNDNSCGTVGPHLPKTLLEEFGLRAIDQALRDLERRGQIQILGDMIRLAA